MERIAVEEVQNDPEGSEINVRGGMQDPRWPAEEGWVKMSEDYQGVDIHYVYNKITGECDDFKFKDER